MGHPEIIDSPELFDQELVRLVRGATKLSVEVLGKKLPVDTACFFARDTDEAKFLRDMIFRLGKQSRFSHGKTTYVDVNPPLEIDGQEICILGVRDPDETRTERGYGDCPVVGIDSFIVHNSAIEGAKVVVSGTGKTMLELRHPDIDARVYIVDAKDHQF